MSSALVFRSPKGGHRVQTHERICVHVLGVFRDQMPADWDGGTIKDRFSLEHVVKLVQSVVKALGHNDLVSRSINWEGCPTQSAWRPY